MKAAPIIRFPQGLFPELRHRLLDGQEFETFALLLGKCTSADGHMIVRVGEAIYPRRDDYAGQGVASLRIKREFIYRQLMTMQQEGRYDTVIDVHTHPFCQSGASFSAVDDQDEIDFHLWLSATLGTPGYASIVLSQSDYLARVWKMDGGRPIATSAQVKTQIVAEVWPCAESPDGGRVAPDPHDLETGFLARSTLALGLDNMRKLATDQSITVVGIGGLGSVIAENLVHLGFPVLHLIDPDRVELTNLNRIVGAYYSDAVQNRLKVDVVREHLLKINPKARVHGHAIGVEDDAALAVLMQSDWVIVATDNHFSRYHVQNTALQLGVPLISAGVNITVENGEIVDYSGEVIVARSGDGLCLNCLGRINPTQVAAHNLKDGSIGEELVRRGYVAGHDVKEPAVKTLNSIVGGISAEVILNQFTQRQPHYPIWVFESNQQFAMYPDHDSANNRATNCYFCS